MQKVSQQGVSIALLHHNYTKVSLKNSDNKYRVLMVIPYTFVVI